MSEKKCPECGSKKLKYTTEGLICQDCGLVVESDVIFSGSMLV